MHRRRFEPLSELQSQFGDQIRDAAEAAYAVVGKQINLGSAKQLQVVLFDELGMPKTKRTNRLSSIWFCVRNLHHRQGGWPLALRKSRPRSRHSEKLTTASTLATIALRAPASEGGNHEEPAGGCGCGGCAAWSRQRLPGLVLHGIIGVVVIGLVIGCGRNVAAELNHGSTRPTTPGC